MPVVTIGGEKGGTGKSTLATNLAVEAVNRGAGRYVALINCDPQNTAGKWAERRNDEIARRNTEGGKLLYPVYCYTLSGRNIHREIEKMANDYDLVVVDGAGRDAPELRTAMLASNLFLTPLRASIADVETMETVSWLAEQAATLNPRLRAAWVLNHVKTVSRDLRRQQMTDVMSDFPFFSTFRTLVAAREVYAEALALGLGVSEMVRANPKAATEMAFFYEEVIECLQTP